MSMTEYQKRRIASTPLSMRVALVVVGALASIGAAAGVNVLLNDEPVWAVAVPIGVAVGVVMAYQYLWVPRRR